MAINILRQNTDKVAQLLKETGQLGRARLLDALQEMQDGVRILASWKYVLPFAGWRTEKINGEWEWFDKRTGKTHRFHSVRNVKIWNTNNKRLTARTGRLQDWLNQTSKWGGNENSRRMSNIKGITGDVGSSGAFMINSTLEIFPAGQTKDNYKGERKLRSEPANYGFFHEIGKSRSKIKRKFLEPAFREFNTRANLSKFFAKYVETEMIRQSEKLQAVA